MSCHQKPAIDDVTGVNFVHGQHCLTNTASEDAHPHLGQIWVWERAEIRPNFNNNCLN